jgi:hypothetical protein
MSGSREQHPESPENRAAGRRPDRIGDSLGDAGSDTPVRYQIRRSVYCRRCAYDLRSLDVEGRCPECGLDIWPSVIHMVDPAASKLPKLRDPRGVGNALVWLFGCALLASTMLSISGIMLIVDRSPPMGMTFFVLHFPPDLTLLSGLAAMAGLWSVWKFMPPKGSSPDLAVRRDLWLMAAALVIWAAATLGLWERERAWARMGLTSDAETVIAVRSLAHLTIAIAATVGLHSVRRLMEAIGMRSREYRRAGGGKQSIKPMIVGTIGVAVGSLCRYLGTFDRLPSELQGLGVIIVWVSMLMLLIGLGYLLVNAWWIRRVLRKPPPRLRDLLQAIPERTPPMDGEG